MMSALIIRKNNRIKAHQDKIIMMKYKSKSNITNNKFKAYN